MQAFAAGFIITSETILELANHSKSLWKLMNESERVDLLKEVTSNRELEGITVRYSLKKPFEILKKIKNLGQFKKWCTLMGEYRTAILEIAAQQALVIITTLLQIYNNQTVLSFVLTLKIMFSLVLTCSHKTKDTIQVPIR